MWTQAVVAPAAVGELDRVGSSPIAAAMATATAVRASGIRGRRHDERGGNSNRIAFQRRPSGLLDEVVEGKPATPLAPVRCRWRLVYRRLGRRQPPPSTIGGVGSSSKEVTDESLPH